MKTEACFKSGDDLLCVEREYTDRAPIVPLRTRYYLNSEEISEERSLAVLDDWRATGREIELVS